MPRRAVNRPSPDVLNCNPGAHMRRLLLWGTIAGFAACLIRPTLVSITPDYGYADGCVDVLVQGHHLGTNATAHIGDAEFLELLPAEEDPDRPEHAQDVGFLYTGLVPASPSGEAGWFDVVVTIDGEELKIRDGWYYRSCPGSLVVDAFTVPDPATVGSQLTFVGCNLGPDVTVQFLDLYGVLQATTQLVSDCLTARVHANVPALPAGDYNVQLVHADGTIYAGPCGVDSGDTGVTCEPIFINVPARRGAE